MSELAQLRDSTGSLNDLQSLRAILQHEGYLFLRRLIDPVRVRRVKQDIVAILRERYIIEHGDTDEPLWSGGPIPTEAEWMACYDKIVRLESFRNLAESGEIVQLLEGVLETPIRVWNQRLIRVVYPDPDAAPPVGLGAHQDGNSKFAYGADTFYTGWVPLMEINQQVGGLAVARGSHTKGLLDHSGTLASSTTRTAKQQLTLALEDASWLTTEFKPGDVVLFSSRTVHRGLPNCSDRIRLSCDFRYQPAGESASWIADTLGPDVRRVAQQIDEIIASRALYVTTRATGRVLEGVRRRMMEEKSTSMERAQVLAAEIERSNSP